MGGAEINFASTRLMASKLTDESLDVISKKERTRGRYLPRTVIVLSQEYILVELDREAAQSQTR
jgi:hypothetical protein